MATKTTQNAAGGLMEELPIDRLREEAMEFGKALARKGASRIGERLTGATDKVGGLSDLVPGPGDVVKAAAKAPLKPVKDAASKVKDALPGTGSDDSDDSDEERAKKNQVGDGTNLKVTNIVETIDVPVSREVAYDLWTQFEEFPSFMKKVENVKQKDPEVVSWKAQIFWSHRTWTAKIVDQVRPERIVWKSEADKGKVDGAVTFHELAPDLTRVLVSLEYHPQGLFERTGNLWRAQGRRVRLELKHFRRYVANHAILKQDDVEGWEGEIHDGKVQRRSSNGSTAKKSASGGSTAKKSASNGSPARKSAGGSTAKKSASGGSTAKKSASSGSTAKKSASSGSTAKKSASSGSTAKKSAAKKSASGSTTRKSSSSGSSARKSAAKKSSTSKRTAAAAKTAPRRTTASATTRSGSSGGSRSSAQKSGQKSTRKAGGSSRTRSRS